VIDVAGLTAIDVHVHTERTRAGHDPMPPDLRAASRRYFGDKCLDRPLRLVPQVFPAPARPVREHAPEGKALFGSDFPLVTPDRWLADFERASFRDEVRPLVLKENAARLLNL